MRSRAWTPRRYAAPGTSRFSAEAAPSARSGPRTGPRAELAVAPAGCDRISPVRRPMRGGPMARRALITGITGQDGSYLAELLLAKGYVVHGLRRRSSTFNSSRIEHLYQDPHDPDTRLFLHYADLSDGARLIRLLHRIQPDEVYNLAGQSHVAVSFDEPEHTALTTGVGAIT